MHQTQHSRQPGTAQSTAALRRMQCFVRYGLPAALAAAAVAAATLPAPVGAAGLRVDRGAAVALPEAAQIRADAPGEPGIRASRGGTVTGTGTQVTATGEAAPAILAERGGSVELESATVTAQGVGAPAMRAERGGTIGLRASVAVSMDPGAAVAEAGHGSTLSAAGSRLISAGPGIRVRDGASVYLDNTIVSARGASLESTLGRAAVQRLVAANGSRLLENDGTLLRVNREAGGEDGVVVLHLDGAQARGDIVDAGAGASPESGGTYVSLTRGTHYAGSVQGIRSLHVVGATAELAGGRIEQGVPVIGGDALHAEQGGQVTASGPLEISVSGSGAPGEGPAVGVRADTGASIVLQGGSVTMTGASNSRGVLATSGGAITLRGVAVTTQAEGAHGVQAGASGHPPAEGTRVELDGAQVRTRGAGAHGLMADQPDGRVAGNADVLTEGAGALGALASHGGTVALQGGTVHATGAQAAAAGAMSGGELELGAVDLRSARSDGIALTDAATLTLTGTRVSAQGAAIASSLTQAGQRQSIQIDAATRMDAAAGALVRVTRNAAGADGTVEVRWGEGAQLHGDLLDEQARPGQGGLFVTLAKGASYQGRTAGVRQLTAEGGNTLSLQPGSTLGGLAAGPGGQVHGGSAAAPVRAGGDVLVDGARLGGHWVVGGTLAARSGAVIDPGESVGTMRVGAIDWSDAQYRVQLGGAGQADRVDVTGTQVAELSGTSVAATPLQGARLRLNSDYTVLTAPGGVRGGFSSLSWDGPSRLLKLVPVYGPRHAALRLTVDHDAIDGLPLTPNENETAHGAGSVAGENDLVDDVFIDGNLDAFNQLSGEIHPSARAMMLAGSSMLAGIAQQRMRANLGAGMQAGAPLAALAEIQTVDLQADTPDASAWPRSSAFPMWAQFVAGRQTLGSDGNAAQAVQTLNGFFFGGDAEVGGGWRLGAGAGYTDGTIDVDARNSQAKVETYSLALYGGNGWQAGPGRINLLVGAGHAWHDLDVTRTVALGAGQTLTSSYDGRTTQAHAELGYALPLGELLVLEPFAGAAWLRQKTDDFSESGGDAALRGSSETADVTTFTLGLRGAASFRVNGAQATLSAGLGWRHANGDTRPRTTMAFLQGDGADFNIAGAPVAEDAAVFGLGAEIALGGNAAMGLNYSGQVGDSNREHMGGVYLKLRF